MTFKTKESRLLLVLGAFFVANTLMSEFIGVKIFSVEGVLGIKKFDINLFGVPNLSYNMSAGVLTWPIVFIMTDIINEYFGVRQVRFLSILTAVLIGFSFFMIWMAIHLEPSDFWVMREVDGKQFNMSIAFNKIFGQGMWIILGSVVAFLVSQMVDVLIFHKIKKFTGDKALWLRATGSTLVSQLVDSFVVIFIAFYLNPETRWSWQMVAAIGLVGYTYKFVVALLMTPILYVVHGVIDRYLGRDLAHRMIEMATRG